MGEDGCWCLASGEAKHESSMMPLFAIHLRDISICVLSLIFAIHYKDITMPPLSDMHHRDICIRTCIHTDLCIHIHMHISLSCIWNIDSKCAWWLTNLIGQVSYYLWQILLLCLVPYYPRQILLSLFTLLIFKLLGVNYQLFRSHSEAWNAQLTL